ncbi:hypothetical protein CA11_33050 [Gimesia maris]|uniref:hypothetical protein n=1 Tax=Gimesia maris TaxID=122 RepID=UPI0011888904|nr:hypothetical protein [Gimesia maris]QDU15480.1 hypothetical protein CA11_33050 [Gimesia maris]
MSYRKVVIFVIFAATFEGAYKRGISINNTGIQLLQIFVLFINYSIFSLYIYRFMALEFLYFVMQYFDNNYNYSANKEKRLIRAELHLVYGVTPTRRCGEYSIKAKAVKTIYLPCKPEEVEMIIADDNPSEWPFEDLLGHSYQIQDLLQANGKLMLSVVFSDGECSTLDELNERNKYLEKHGWTVFESSDNTTVSSMSKLTSC